MSVESVEFQELYNAFQPRILRYLTRLVGEHEAEDLAQEVFVKISRALPSFRGDSQLSTWVYQIATNAALDRLRSPAYRRSFSVEPSDDPACIEPGSPPALIAPQAPSAEQQLVRQEMDECLAEYIQRLPNHYRTVFVLSDLEGLQNAEIAEILNITLGTVKIRLHRARAMLREDLAKNCESYWLEDNEFVPALRRASRKSPPAR